MKISTYNNRTAVTFNIKGFGGELVKAANAVHEITKKYNGQDMLFENKAPYKFGENSVTAHNGDIGGTITFHSHSCNHVEASQELITLLLTFGVSKPKYFQEVVKTHRADGTAYKCPQYFIEEVK